MPRGVDERIVILDIDEKSLQEIGRWPWPRDTMARLVNKLFDQYQVGIVGFDVVFADRYPPDPRAGRPGEKGAAPGRRLQRALPEDAPRPRQRRPLRPRHRRQARGPWLLPEQREGREAHRLDSRPRAAQGHLCRPRRGRHDMGRLRRQHPGDSVEREDRRPFQSVRRRRRRDPPRAYDRAARRRLLRIAVARDGAHAALAAEQGGQDSCDRAGIRARALRQPRLRRPRVDQGRAGHHPGRRGGDHARSVPRRQGQFPLHLARRRGVRPRRARAAARQTGDRRHYRAGPARLALDAGGQCDPGVEIHATWSPA